MPSIRAGSGISVSGAGTASSPFVVSATITDFASSIAGVDTPTVDMSVVGSGTPQDPFLISANASITMAQLADWDDPAGPALGDVPVWNGIAWEAAPPPTVPPGLVNTAAGIVGDGTLATPIKAAVSSTSLTATTGLAVYVDTAGQLRAERPTATAVTWGSITGKPSTFPTTWSEVASKPATFTPSTHYHNTLNYNSRAVVLDAANFYLTNGQGAVWIVDSSGTLQAGTVPAARVTGLGNYATRPNLGWSARAVADVTGGNALGMYWNGSTPILRVDATDFPLATVSLVSAVQNGLQFNIDNTWQLANNKANWWGGPDGVRYARGPEPGAYAREAGASRFATWMDGGLEFGRATSSRRYKEDIAPWETSLDAWLSIEPKVFHRKIDPEGLMDVGAIAEELEDAGLGDALYYDDEGRPDGIKDWVVTWAHQALLVDLAARVAALESAKTTKKRGA